MVELNNVVLLMRMEQNGVLSPTLLHQDCNNRNAKLEASIQ